MTATTIRPFALDRREDVTGASGTGRVALGAQWPDGTCVIRWQTELRSTAIYDNIAELEAIHGHDGRTTVTWLDQDAAVECDGSYRCTAAPHTEGCMSGDVEALREQGDLWSAIDWTLWGHGLGDVLRERMSDTMLAALPQEDFDKAIELMQLWKERRGHPHLKEQYDDLRAQINAYRETLGAIWLYINWRYVTKQLTTEQKELWADAVDAFGEPEPGKAERWWRDDFKEQQP